MPRSRAFAELLAILVPPVCASCRACLRDPRGRLCPDCLRALPWLGPGGCPRCGLPVHRAGGRCPAARAPWARAWAPLAYDGVARELVLAVKVRGAVGLTELMAAQLAANLPRDLRGPDAGVVVPVPAQPARRRRRGFDPTAALAGAFAARAGRPLEPCLRRRDRAAPQRRTARAGRRAPGRLRIEAAGTVPERVLLLDDVHTTGATLEACARALRAAGCRRVVAVTYARTL